MAKVDFKPEHLHSLQDTYLSLSFAGKTLSGTFVSNKINPWEILNSTTVGGCNAILQRLKAQKSALEDNGISEWEVDTETKNAAEELETWIKFVNLCIGFKLSEEQKRNEADDKAEKIKRLEKRINAEADKNKTLTDLQEELKQLKGE